MVMCEVASGDGDGDSCRVPWIAADVFGGIEAFWIEAIGFDLVTTVVTVSLVDGFLQRLVEGASLAETLAEEVAPLGGQSAPGQFVNLHPLTIPEAAFGHREKAPQGFFLRKNPTGFFPWT